MTLSRPIPRLLLVLAAIMAGSGAGRAASTPPTPLTAEEQRLIAAVEAGKDDFGPALGQAVQIDSATENLAGVRQLGELFAQQLTELGFESRFVPLLTSTGRAGHLVAEHRGTKGQRVLLIGHLDTVYPGANFQRKGEEVSGAGVADMKGGDIVMIHALRALHRAGLLADTQITVIMDGDEEAVGNPSELCRRELLNAAKHSDLALAFESAIGNTGTVARRGYAGWTLEVQGATGHSGGIFSAAVGSGSVFETARILQGFYEQLRQLDGVTINPALIAGGAEAELSRTGGTVAGKANIIAQRTLVRGDLRCLSAAQFAEARARMEAVVAKHLPRTSAVLTFLDDVYPPMDATPQNYALLAQLDQASRDLG